MPGGPGGGGGAAGETAGYKYGTPGVGGGGQAYFYFIVS